MKKIYLLLFAVFSTFLLNAQTIVLNATLSGKITSADAKTDGDLTNISATATTGDRGYIKFDLSSVPSGAIITSASLKVTAIAPTTSSTSTVNKITSTTLDASTATTGFYTAITSATTVNTGTSWAGTAPFALNLPINAAGITALKAAHVGSQQITYGLVRGSTNIYTFAGYDNATTTNQPQLTITYTVPTIPPACATGLVPANAATGVAVSGAISWAATPEAFSYDIYLGKTTNPSLLGNVLGTSATVSAGFDFNTLYYWKIVPKNAIGAAIGCTEQTFTTGTTPAATCVTGLYPTTANTGCTLGDAIKNVTFVNINNTTTCTASPYYTLNSTPIASPVPVGSGTSISITNGDPDDRAKVWIDLNDNGIFANDELFFNAKGANLSGSITLPLTAPLGNHKMRVRIVWMSNPTTQPEQNFTACSLQNYGEVEDYIINVTAAASCVNPTGLVASAITTNSASLDWNAVAGAVGYVYSFGTTNTPPASPSTATPTTGITYSASGLDPLTTYFMHVATDCGGTYSSWSTTSFTTPVDCATATVLACGGTPTAAVFPAGAGVWNFAGTNPTNSCGAATAGLEKVYKFTPTLSGVHAITITTASTGSGIDFLIKESSNGCTASGFTCVGSSSVPSGTSLNTPSLIAGTEYLIVADPQLSTGSTVSFRIDCPAPIPNCVANIAPADMATGVTTPVNLSWNADANATSYNVYLGTVNPPTTTIANAVTGTSYSWTSALPATQYYWYVVPVNISGSATGCATTNVTSFTTTNICTPFTTNGGALGDALLDFVLNGESATAISVIGAAPIASPGYIDLTATTTVDLAAGKAYAGNFKTQDGSDNLTIWIDYNNNGGFEANEIVLNHLKPLGASSTSPYSIFISPTASVGTHKMRVRNIYNTAPTTPIDACAAYAYGEGKDFTINIVASGSPYLVSSIGAAACANMAKTTIDAGSNNTSVQVPLLDATGAIVAQVNANGNNLGTITSSVYRNITTPRIAGGSYYMDRNITITPATQPSTGNVNLRLYYTVAELAALIAVAPVTSPTSVTVTKTSQVCSAAFVAPGTFLAHAGDGSLGSDYYLDVATPAFSTFYINSANSALPVSIQFFKGTKQAGTNYLDWKVTCTSAPSLTISLERSSDGRNFKSINEENALAVRCLQGFDYTDASPFAGANYYRLKLTTPTGEVSYSKIVMLLNKEKGFELISLAPIPVKNVAILTLTSANAGKIDIRVTDVAGKSVAKQTIIVIAGNNPIDVNFETLGMGTYMITATNADGEIKTTRFVKY